MLFVLINCFLLFQAYVEKDLDDVSIRYCFVIVIIESEMLLHYISLLF